MHTGRLISLGFQIRTTDGQPAGGKVQDSSTGNLIKFLTADEFEKEVSRDEQVCHSLLRGRVIEQTIDWTV